MLGALSPTLENPMALMRNRLVVLSRLLVLLAPVALFGLAGCESGTEEPEAPPAEPIEFGATPAEELPAGETPAASTSEDGTSLPFELPEGAVAAIPDNFPSSLPVYPNAKPAVGMGGEVNGGQRSGVQLMSPDAPADILAYYETNLPQQGWDIQETADIGTGKSISATDGSTTLLLFVADGPDGESIVYMMTEESGL